MDKIDPVVKSTNGFDRMSNNGENGNGLVTEGLLIMNAAKQHKEKPKRKSSRLISYLTMETLKFRQGIRVIMQPRIHVAVINEVLNCQ